MTVGIDLNGKVAIVTGGGDGIGGAVADTLAKAGAHVVLAEIETSRAAARVAAIQQAGGSVEAHLVDVLDQEQLAAFTSEVLAGHSSVDILVNNVGHYLRPRAFLRSDEDHWDALHEVNVVHVLRCCRAFMPGMVERGSGSVINVTSVEGIRGYPPDPVYGAYKAAVGHFTKCLALEVAAAGVRVNAIAPDVTETIQVPYSSIVPDDQWDRWPIWVPVGRVGQPADSADVVLFLASDLSRFVTGHVIPTDGGTLAAGGWFRTTDHGHWTNRPRDP